MPLQVRESISPASPGTAVLELTGAIDIDGIAGLGSKLDELASLNKPRVGLDLSGIRYVSSSGIGLLIRHAQALDQRGGGLVLLGVPQKVRIVLDMLGVERCFAGVCDLKPGHFSRSA